MLNSAPSAPTRATKFVWSLRTVLVVSLVFFSLIPAALVGWYLYDSNIKTVSNLTAKVLEDTTRRVQADTEHLLDNANVVFNGLIPNAPNALGLARARELMQKPELFEQAAFAMTRMSPNVPYLYFGTDLGEFSGVDVNSADIEAPVRVPVRQVGDQGRHTYGAKFPGDRSNKTLLEADNYEPRKRPWYVAAIEKKARVFSSVYPSVYNKQLVITLSQPIYQTNGEVQGVFALDLYLKRLSEQVQNMSLSSRGVAFIVDELGFFVASSAGDTLFAENNGQVERYKPSSSNNHVIRNAYAEVLPSLGEKQSDGLQRVAFQRQIGQGDDALIVALKPFGDGHGLRWTLVVAAPQSDFAAASQAALRESVLIAMGLVGLATALALMLAYGLSRRFLALGQAAEQLAAGQVPVVQTGAHISEVRRLSQTLHDSAQEIVSNRQAIDTQTRALENANQTLESRVLSRTAELEASREAAMSAMHAKAAFLATMSHEIRTPLNGVVGMTTLLADTPLNHEQSDYLHTMRVSSDQLLGVINDILDFSKIESGKLDLESEPLHLLSAVEEACDIAAPRAREKALELLVDHEDGLPVWVRGDVTRLRQILLNFVNNAVKFTDKGQVLVSVHVLEEFKPDQDALIEFRVKDTGIGISADKQNALFQSFSQVDTSTTRKYGGTGLGLAISKRLSEQMGGTVSVISAPGEGSTFSFTARLGYADTPDISESSQSHMVSLASKCVVLVDDTALNLRILDKQLTRWGMQTTRFERAQPALDWLKVNPVDVVITDMHMPDMDGQTFATTLRGVSPNLPIVLLTSGVMPVGEAAQCFDARMLKPYRQTQLFDTLARVVTLPADRLKDKTKQASLAAPALSKNQRILVADDNPVNLKVVVAMLSKLGYSSNTCANGLETVDAVSISLRKDAISNGHVPYAAILMDANMPVMDGITAARLIVDTHGRSAPPIIAITASVLEEDRKRCQDAGMVGFLAKPLRMDELADSLIRYAVTQSPSDLADTVSSTSLDPTIAINTGAAYAVNTPLSAKNAIPKVIQLMDWNRLDEFKEFDDEARTTTREVIALFIQDAPKRLADIYNILGLRNSADFSRAAHALKGAASNVGAKALSIACFNLEQDCLHDRWPVNANEQVAAIDALTQQSLQALAHWSA